MRAAQRTEARQRRHEPAQLAAEERREAPLRPHWCPCGYLSFYGHCVRCSLYPGYCAGAVVAPWLRPHAPPPATTTSIPSALLLTREASAAVAAVQAQREAEMRLAQEKATAASRSFAAREGAAETTVVLALGCGALLALLADGLLTAEDAALYTAR